MAGLGMQQHERLLLLLAAMVELYKPEGSYHAILPSHPAILLEP
jgi:hypothetical protein